MQRPNGQKQRLSRWAINYNFSWLGSMDFKISSFMVSHGFGSCLIACLCFSEWLTSHNSGDIVILNREQVGNPQIRHNDCQITIPKFHQKANGILCKVQSILFFFDPGLIYRSI